MAIWLLLVGIACWVRPAPGLEPQVPAALRGTEAGNVGQSPTSLISPAADLDNPVGHALIGAIGVAAMAFAGRSIARTKLEKARIVKMDKQNTDVAQLKQLAASGSLPSVVIVKGVISAEGENVTPASPGIQGLADKVGTIEQPENDWVKIAQMAKQGGEGAKQLTDIMAKQTGVRPEDIPDVADDYTKRWGGDPSGAALILTEILVARLCVMVLKEKKDDRTEVKRIARKYSYNVFNARNASAGIHLVDMQGQKLPLQLPVANVVKEVALGEAPSLFLPTADVLSEFGNMLSSEGLDFQGQHIDLSKMPPTTISDPSTLLSKFIFVDVQSANDLGGMGANEDVLQQISQSYCRDRPAQFLWEPKGFYDHEGNDLPNGATFKTRGMVSAAQLLQQAQQAATENTRITNFCEPTFQRSELDLRRNDENCFRYTELAIPRGTPVTILARPVKDANGSLKLVPPNKAEHGMDDSNPDAERFRFRILHGHSVENLIKQRNVNMNQYYGFGLVGAFMTVWAAAGCPGLS